MAERTPQLNEMPRALWEQTEAVIGRFEADWLQGAAPNIDPFLPATGAERRRVLIELVHIDLEYRLKAGEAVRLETYLERFLELAGERRVVLELLDTEYRHRRRGDPGLALEEYERRFPEYGRDLAERLRSESPPGPAPWPDSAVVTLLPAPHAPMAVELCAMLAPAQGPDELGRLGPYRVLAVLGHGGMGVVFRAEDPQLQRAVAIKAMLPWVAAFPAARLRFLREARAVAAIKHNHIVTIHQVGEVPGTPFLAMELLDGEGLDARLQREPSLSLAEVVRIGREVAEGLEAAHERGLIHRDIKPANIWLEGKRAHVKVLDFGLARSTTNDPHLTQTGAIVGTPAYMAPEQTNGSALDHRGDLFSLGCVLYRLCTGEMPFKGKDLLSTIAALARDQPLAPATLGLGVPMALSDLIMELLAKKPEERPISARAVAERLQRIAADPIAFVASGAATRRRPTAWRWSVIGTAAALLFGLASWAAVQFQTNGQTDAGPNAGVERPPEHESAPQATLSPADALRREDIPAYELAAAGNGDPTKALPELVAVLGDSRLKQWGTVRSVALSRDGKLLASAGADGAVRLWDPATGKALRTCVRDGFCQQFAVAISPDGGTVAAGGMDSVVTLWDAATGQKRRSIDARGSLIRSIAFSPDGLTIAAETQEFIKLWETTTGTVKQTITPPKMLSDTDRSIAFCPDGLGVAAACFDGNAYLWDAATGKLRQTFTGNNTAWVRAVAISPDGKTLAASSEDATIRVWDVATAASQRIIRPNSQHILNMAFSPDGQTLAACDRDTSRLRLWNMASGEERSVSGDVARSLSFAGKGTMLATGGESGVVKLWDVATGNEIVKLPDGGGAIDCVAVSPDGRTVAAAGSNHNVVHLWDVATGRDRRPPLLHEGRAESATFSPDGKLLATAGWGRLWQWEVATGNYRGQLGDARPWEVSFPAFSPDGRLLAWGERNGAVKLFDRKAGLVSQVLEGHKRQVACVAFSPKEQVLATGSLDRTVRIWDLTTGKELHAFALHQERILRFAFSPDGQTLAIAEYESHTVDLWNVTTGKLRRVLNNEGAFACNSVAFSPDGQTLAIATAGAEVTLWNWRDGSLLHTYRLLPRGCFGNVWDVAFTPDGRHLVTGNGNGTAYILRLDQSRAGR